MCRCSGHCEWSKAAAAVETPAVPGFKVPLKDRKKVPLATGLLDYFPDALAEVAHCSYVASQQHNHEVMYWERGKSNDHADCLMRHFADRGKRDTDGVRHRAKVAWRALADLQLEIEAEAQNSK